MGQVKPPLIHSIRALFEAGLTFRHNGHIRASLLELLQRHSSTDSSQQTFTLSSNVKNTSFAYASHWFSTLESVNAILLISFWDEAIAIASSFEDNSKYRYVLCIYINGTAHRLANTSSSPRL